MAERIMDGGDIMIDVLNNQGIEYLIASPGSEWPPVWEALCRRAAEGEIAPKYITCRHESLAIGMAAGYQRATNRLPAVLLHTISGSLNCANNIWGALIDRTPMLICASESIGYGEMDGPDPGPQWLPYLAGIGGPTKLVDAFTKWAATVRTPVTFADTIHRACQIANTTPKGPTFVNSPLELMLQKIPVQDIPRPPEYTSVANPDSETIARIADLLLGAKRPIIMTESLGKDHAAVIDLIDLAEQMAIPVIEAPAPDCMNFPTGHYLHQGYDPTPYMGDSDVVLLLSSIAPWHPPSKGPGNECVIVDFNSDPNRDLKPYSGYRASISVPGEVGPGLKELLNAVKQRSQALEQNADLYAARAQSFRIEHQKRFRKLDEEAQAVSQNSPIHPIWASYLINKVVPDDAVVVQELIVHRRLLDAYLDRQHPGGYMRSFGGLGQGLPNALGIKLAHPEKLVVAVLGDGSFNYNPVHACFGLCQEYDMPILAVIFNNRGYASMQRGINHLYPGGFGESAGRDLATSIPVGPEYPKLVEAFGGWGITVNDPGELESALRAGIKAVESGKPALVDIVLEW